MNSHGKHLKPDPLSSLVMSFLKRRKYTDNEVSKMKEQATTERNVENIAFRTSVSNECGVPNVLSLSVNHLDPNAFDEQFGNLKSFITGVNQAYRLELSKLLFPMFAVFYLELIAKGHLVSAQNFFSKYSNDMLVEHKDDIQHLQAITDSERLKSSDIAANFRRSKFVLKLSSKVFTYFMQYLKNQNRLLLLQILSRNFAIEILHTKPGHSNNGNNGEEETEEGSSAAKPSKDSKHSKVAVQKEDSSLLTLTLSPPPSSLSSVAISHDSSLLCGGFEDSFIQLWSLTPKKLIQSKCKMTDISKIVLAPDVVPEKSRIETTSQETITLQGHSGPVYATCFSPDGTILLSASEDTTVRLWNVHSYTNVVQYKGHDSPVWSLDASSQSLYFATGSHDNTARLWNTEYNYPLRIFAGHLQDVESVKFHPNCTYLATGSADRTCRLWDIQTGNCVRLFRGHKGSVLSLAISPDGQYLVSAGEDRRIRVWDLAAGNLLKELRGHTDTIYSMSFSNDGTLLASGGLDNVVRVWDFGQVRNAPATNAATSTELLASFPTKNSSVHCVQFSTCNVLLACGANAS